MKKVAPKVGQESVWDYPRPPAIELCSKHVRIVFDGNIICDSSRAFRILETSHPPSFYIPIMDFAEGTLRKTERTSFCEFKGEAHYYHIANQQRVSEFAAWGYEQPNEKYEQITGCVSVYAHKMEACILGDEVVQPQEGDFYGGWITSNIVGPFKGAPGTWGW